ncbi:MAG: hypothetical protein JO257_33170 [Deltaproteobacteria bacterium]|nr:hypothetical protein [Deltaproteobacteria bacterium]
MRKLALLLALAGCAQAQRHPAVAIGIVGAVVSGLACEMDSPAHQSTCGIIMLAAGGGLGVITGIATLIGNTNDTSVTSGDDDMEMEGGAVRVHTHTAPPPVPIDAGVVVDSAVGSAAGSVSGSGSAVERTDMKAGSDQ